MYARAYTHEHQFNLLGGLASRMAEEPFRLVVIMCCEFNEFHGCFAKPFFHHPKWKVTFASTVAVA